MGAKVTRLLVATGLDLMCRPLGVIAKIHHRNADPTPNHIFRGHPSYDPSTAIRGDGSFVRVRSFGW